MIYKEKLKDIKAFVFDVDGIFTDGTIYLMPDGSMCRTMNVLDGYAVVRALKSGYKIGIITGGDDPMVKQRIHYLGIGACPPNAVPEIKKVADYITPVNGGSGAVRDVIEQVMKAQGKWDIQDNTQSI